MRGRRGGATTAVRQRDVGWVCLYDFSSAISLQLVQVPANVVQTAVILASSCDVSATLAV